MTSHSRKFDDLLEFEYENINLKLILYCGTCVILLNCSGTRYGRWSRRSRSCRVSCGPGCICRRCPTSHLTSRATSLTTAASCLTPRKVPIHHLTFITYKSSLFYSFINQWKIRQVLLNSLINSQHCMR